MISQKHQHIPEVDQFYAYLAYELQLRPLSIDAYLADTLALCKYLPKAGKGHVALEELESFIASLAQLGMAKATLARATSSIKRYFEFRHQVLGEEENPAALLEVPRLTRKLPEVLTVEEVDALTACVDRSTPNGERDFCLLEVLYGCGLRVSEAASLEINRVHFQEEFISVVGKGDKERLVPVGGATLKVINNYLEHTRKSWPTAQKTQAPAFS